MLPRLYRDSIWILLSLWLASCATLTAPRHQTLNHALNAAQATVAAANDAIAVLVTDRTITVEQAEQLGAVAGAAHEVHARSRRRGRRSSAAAGARRGSRLPERLPQEPESTMTPAAIMQLLAILGQLGTTLIQEGRDASELEEAAIEAHLKAAVSASRQRRIDAIAARRASDAAEG